MKRKIQLIEVLLTLPALAALLYAIIHQIQ